MRILRRIAAAALLLILALFLTVQVQQRILRHRAERLHAEILALQLHPGTFADVQRLQKEWGAHAHYNGECTPHHCIYEITLTDFLTGAIFESHKVVPAWAVRAYIWLSPPPTDIYAQVRVRDNRMWGAQYIISVWAMPSGSPDQSFAIIIDLDYGTRITAHHGSGLPVLALRRGYSIGGPGGCTFCIERWINLGPDTPAADLIRLNQINFKCMSTGTACTELDDLLPALKQEPQTTDAELLAAEHDCAIPLATFAREADNIVLAEVTKRYDLPGQNKPGPDPMWTIRVLQRIKDAHNQSIGRTHDIYAPVPGNVIGQQFYILYHQPGNVQDPTILETNLCSVFPATQDNLSAIQHGIAQDPSVGESYNPAFAE